MLYWPWFILAIIYGACVGSFLNVVIYRLPEGRSLWKPPSHCPKCDHRLRWWENVPILAWIYLRGRCTNCKTPFSIQYPLIEAFTAIVFGGLFLLFYNSGLHPNWERATLVGSWPTLVVHLALAAALIAATMIDARYFIIPLSVPWTAAGIAMVGLPLAAIWIPSLTNLPPVFQAPPHDLYAVEFTPGAAKLGLGAGAGLLVALALLRLKLIPRSMEEPEADKPILPENEAQPATAGESPHDEQVDENATPKRGAVNAMGQDAQPQWDELEHPRREVMKECLFVAWPFIGGFLTYGLWPASAQPLPNWLAVLGAVLLGGFVGGGLVWIVRILGTLGFGREAMGLGDVHLMFAVGACVGWLGAIVAFFVAPFLGLAWTILAVGAGRVLKREVHQIPYGPHLAAASLLVMALGGYRILAVVGVM